MRSIKVYLYQFILILAIQGCHVYLIDKEPAARQLTNVKIERKTNVNFDFATGKSYGNRTYRNNLRYFIIENKSSIVDTIFPADIKFFLKSGSNSAYLDPFQIIFKDGYFISFDDTTLKTSPKCKYCRINIDSVEKIAVRGPRLNKKK